MKREILIEGPKGVILDSEMGDDYGIGLDFAGVYSITITVTDQDGGVASLTKSVKIINKLPLVDFEIELTDLYNGRFYNVIAGNTIDPDGYLVSKNIKIIGPPGCETRF